MPTALVIIDGALMEIGVLAAGETARAEDAEFARLKLNRLIDQWKTRELFAFAREHASYTFSTSSQSYTIGATGVFVGSRPVKIERANLVVVASSNLRQGLEVINSDQYGSLNLPATSGTPTKLYYQPLVPDGKLWPYPYPTVTTNKLELFYWLHLSTFAALATSVDLAPGYEEAITLCLAKKLCPAFGMPVSSDLRIEAARAEQYIRGPNSAAPKISTRDAGCPGGTGGSFDIKTGGFA